VVIRYNSIDGIRPNFMPPPKKESPQPKPSGRLERAYAMLHAAAEAGKQCPTNDELATELCFSSTSRAVELVAQLEKEGRIKVERFKSGGRIVEIVATGKKTAVPVRRRSHFRKVN
jgi:hypothetical protein